MAGSVDETYVDLVYDVWRWIIDANNGTGGDVDDLIGIMESNDSPCPADLDDD